MTGKKLTHMDDTGRPQMVDVSGKPPTQRTARARGEVRMATDTLGFIETGAKGKGDIRPVAELAGIMAAKRTADIIPLCHPLALSSVQVRVEADEALPGVIVHADVKTTGPTGVEMEALTAVSAACLTVYDMLKAVDREMEIIGIRLLEKKGGASGDWSAQRV